MINVQNKIIDDKINDIRIKVGRIIQYNIKSTVHDRVISNYPISSDWDDYLKIVVFNVIP